MAQSSDTRGDLPCPRDHVPLQGASGQPSRPPPGWTDSLRPSEAVGPEGALSPTQVDGPGWGPGYPLFVSWPQSAPGRAPKLLAVPGPLRQGRGWKGCWPGVCAVTATNPCTCPSAHLRSTSPALALPGTEGDSLSEIRMRGRCLLSRFLPGGWGDGRQEGSLLALHAPGPGGPPAMPPPCPRPAPSAAHECRHTRFKDRKQALPFGTGVWTRADLSEPRS